MAVTLEKAGALAYLRADGIDAPHLFTTRLGGVSGGSFSSMNIGVHRGDDRTNVLKNYRILGDALGFDVSRLVLTKQTHSDIVLRVDARHWGAGLYRPDLTECDALVTNTAGTALAVFTADCTPILLYDPVTGAVGAAHAGWRGTAKGIAAKTVQAMTACFGCKSNDIRAAIGPHIGQCCFQTDGDVPQAMEQALGTSVRRYIRKSGEKYYVNLTGINALFLREAGVENIESSDLCTACNPSLFWSARIVGSDRGSQGAIIVCKEARS